MDVFALLVPHIARLDGVVGVYEELPHDAVPGKAPLVHLESAGPARRAPSLQGLGADQVGVDVNLYVPEAMWKSGAAMPLALRLRSHLYDFRSGAARAVEVTRPEKWPDRNPHTRRLGMTVEVLLPADF